MTFLVEIEQKEDGYINEFNVERYYRDCKLLTV